MSRGKKRSHQNRRRSSTRSVLLFALLGVVAIVTLGLAVLALNSSRAASVPTGTAAPIPTITAEPVAPQVQLATVLPRLRDLARPFNVVVFSDSTGAGRETWTAKTGEWLGEKYGRTVLGYQWDVHSEPNDYGAGQWHLSEGEGASVTWWNGAAAGEDSVYSLKNIDAIAPISGDSVDLVFISQGHNHGENELRNETPALFREAAARYPNAAIVDIMQNPERLAAPHRDVQKNGVASLGAWARSQNFPVIDVFNPFSTQDIEQIIDDTLYHPTEPGYQFWADVVTTELDAADPGPIE